LIDPTGKTRAVLGPISSDRYGLTFYDLMGKSRAGVGFSEEGKAVLLLRGPQSSVTVMVEDNGLAKVTVESNGGQQTDLLLTPEEETYLSFFDTARVMRAALRLLRCHILEAENDQVALDVVEAHQPDLLVLDDDALAQWLGSSSRSAA
jgi:hypothetical protein